MGAEIPKQYLSLHGKSILEHTLQRLCDHPAIVGAVVVLARDDPWWRQVRIETCKPVRLAVGGTERCHSVLSGIELLAEQADADDWVLVHDAVRPCLRLTDLDRLIAALATHPVGGLLGLPVRDTMKRADGRGAIAETINREGLWHALTPQMFRLCALEHALRACIEQGMLVTDEAQAMELTGSVPRMVEGSADNIKITRPADLVLAELFLATQGARR